jgi:hypothetical protein
MCTKFRLPGLIAFVFLLFKIWQHDAFGQNTYNYQPYPTLLVHGYNATPAGTWGIRTLKLEESDRMLSTTISYTDEKFLDKKNDFKNPFGKKLMECYDQNGDVEDRQTESDYYDYYNRNDSLTAPTSTIFPYEEDFSYNGINHSFVEVYCSYDAYESDDLAGQRNSEFGAWVDGAPFTSDYTYKKIINADEKNYGGQVQILRTRIIQMLNEYYGDWKWVNDPTAKINLVSHSNGGLIIADALKHDEEYYNGGDPWSYSYNTNPSSPVKTHWADPSAASFVITGLGFRLADHINNVYMIDAPLQGSPMADKNGNRSPLMRKLFFSTSALAEVVASNLLTDGLMPRSTAGRYSHSSVD